MAASLNNVVTMTIEGRSDIIKYEAVKHSPRSYHDLRVEDSEKVAVDELGTQTKINRKKYLLVKMSER